VIGFSDAQMELIVGAVSLLPPMARTGFLESVAAI
jgi:hypothetical protein